VKALKLHRSSLLHSVVVLQLIIEILLLYWLIIIYNNYNINYINYRMFGCAANIDMYMHVEFI